MKKVSSYAVCVMLLCMVVSPLHVLSYGGAPSFDPTKVLQESASQEAKEKMIKESPNEFTKQLFDEFEIDVYDGSVPLDQRVKLVSKSEGEAQDVGILAAAAGLIGTVNTAVSVAQKIISFFGKQYSERLVGSFTNNGYSKFQGSAKIMHGRGLPYANVPRFLELLGKSRGVPQQYKEELLTVGKWAQYTTRSDLTKQTVEFSAGSGGSCKVLQFYIQNNRAEQKLELFVMSVENSFKLAPDVFVILEETSQFWGMKSSSKIRFEKRPANLSPEQIKFVSDYFSLIALEQLADFLDVQNGVPDMTPKKNKPKRRGSKRRGSRNDEMWEPDSNDEVRKNLRGPLGPPTRSIWRNNLKAYYPPKPQLKKEVVEYTPRPTGVDVYSGGFHDDLEVKCSGRCAKFNKRSPFGYKQYRRCKHLCENLKPRIDYGEPSIWKPIREDDYAPTFDTFSVRRPSRPMPYRPILHRPPMHIRMADPFREYVQLDSESCSPEGGSCADSSDCCSGDCTPMRGIYRCLSSEDFFSY